VADIPDRPLQAALFAAGGLLVQLLVAVLAIGYLLGHGSPSSHAVNSALFVLIGANALYMLMNLAPFQGSDGARLLAIARQVLAERISK
jgi:Zn-dependent protease